MMGTSQSLSISPGPVYTPPPPSPLLLPPCPPQHPPHTLPHSPGAVDAPVKDGCEMTLMRLNV